LKLQTLKAYAGLPKRIAEKQEMLEVLKSERERVTAVLSDMPKSKGYNPDKLLNETIKIMEQEQELHEELEHLRGAMVAYGEFLDKLQDHEAEVVRTLYGGGKVTWTQAARRLNYSRRTLYYIMEGIKNRGLLE
jgi:hypothetical protein